MCAKCHVCVIITTHVWPSTVYMCTNTNGNTARNRLKPTTIQFNNGQNNKPETGERRHPLTTREIRIVWSADDLIIMAEKEHGHTGYFNVKNYNNRILVVQIDSNLYKQKWVTEFIYSNVLKSRINILLCFRYVHCK